MICALLQIRWPRDALLVPGNQRDALLADSWEKAALSVRAVGAHRLPRHSDTCGKPRTVRNGGRGVCQVIPNMCSRNASTRA